MANESVMQAYTGLVARCNDFSKGRFIMAGNAIKGILRYLAANPSLMGYVAKCNTGVDYKKEFQAAIVGNSFKLPPSSRGVVALVTGLLYEFDRGTQSLHKFLKTFFKSDDIDQSFKMFCNSVIAAYVLAFKNVLDEKEDDKQARFGEGDFVVQDIVKENVVPYITSLTELVVSDERLSDETKDDYITMLEGLYYAFEIASAKMVKVVWLGLRSVMDGYRSAYSYLDGMQALMQSYALI